ncbi:MAG: hypothetical protein ABSG04_07440 [Verrucomicrobiota bacterium]|jgi:hypothetical protein
MKKKTDGKIGKYAFIRNCMVARGSERMTKSQLIALVVKKFPGSYEKQVANIISWMKSAKDSPRALHAIGKTSTLLPEAHAPKATRTAPKTASVKRNFEKYRRSPVVHFQPTPENNLHIAPLRKRRGRLSKVINDALDNYFYSVKSDNEVGNHVRKPI